MSVDKSSRVAPSEVWRSRLRGPISRLTFLQKSLLFAELSYLSYRHEPDALAAAALIELQKVAYFDRDGAQAYRFENEHDCIVVCRGTEPNQWNDLQADANAIMAVAETAGRVHFGFKSEVDALWPMIEPSIRGHDKPLWFTGHSLGGAMATICAGRCMLSKAHTNPTALYTFGSPRVGNRRYVNFAPITHYRWVNNNDIVCRVPPPWMGYRHAGTECYLDAHGTLRELRGWRRFVDRVRGLGMSLLQGRLDYLSDHSMRRYIEAIERIAAKENDPQIQRLVKKWTQAEEISPSAAH
ncbi:MAG: lipase family protein [Planctomycetota bacterium]|nr:lipase family protein [Planctomycetota bacterium]